MIADQLENSAAGAQWKIVGARNHHGIALPLFSLHSKTSCGIGEYPDLIQLFPWCRKIGFDVIQLLPLNDTGLETSPYSALSAHALNPIHLGLSQLPYVLEDVILKKHWQSLTSLNSTNRVSYKEVQKGKASFLRAYYKQYYSTIATTLPYQKFKEEHSAWLPDYAVFKSLKILTNWQPWSCWSEELFKTRSSDIAAEAEYHTFIQYLCFQQFQEVKKRASEQGIFIKGDLPILIDRESADVWSRNDLFILDIVAGAPPDMYAPKGQKWGFPIYNWSTFERDRYQWWVNRLSTAGCLYHLYRLDHVVGFFRIWGIPLPKESKDGFFVPCDPSLWIPQGEKLMHMMLRSSLMLPIGEDLGVIPLEVRQSLKTLGICGTKVMRWERDWNGDRSFIDPKKYQAESMTTVSTHDSEPLALWWHDQQEEARLYAATQGWNYTPELTQEQRMAILSASHHSGSLFHVNLLQEYLALIPEMIAPSSRLEEERINIPGTISQSNWTYKFYPSVEEIVNHNELARLMTALRKE